MGGTADNAPRDGAPDRHVLIAAGGTAGHVVPALAVAEELRARGARVTFAGTADRVEAKLVPAAGHPFLTYRVYGLERRLSPALARGLGAALVAPAACLRILRRTRPDVVFGAGGYVSGPMLAAAAAARIPSALLEVDAHMGLANRLAAPLARRVFLAFPIPGADPPHYLVTGRPVPASILEATREQGRRELEIPENRQVLLVFGGSQGARSINFAAAEAWSAQDPGFTVLHVTGERDFPAIAGRAAAHYRVMAFTTSLGPLLAAADLVVARAGGSVFEIAAAGRPAILIPYPHATGEHQAKNAAFVADGGAAIVLEDGEVSPERLRAEVTALFAAPRRLDGMGVAAARLARPDAARTIASELVRLGR